MSLNSKISKRKIEIVSSEQVNHEVLSELVDMQKNANVNIINDDEIYVSVNSNTKFSEVIKIPKSKRYHLRIDGHTPTADYSQYVNKVKDMIEEMRDV